MLYECIMNLYLFAFPVFLPFFRDQNFISLPPRTKYIYEPEWSARRLSACHVQLSIAFVHREGWKEGHFHIMVLMTRVYVLIWFLCICLLMCLNCRFFSLCFSFKWRKWWWWAYKNNEKLLWSSYSFFKLCFAATLGSFRSFQWQDIDVCLYYSSKRETSFVLQFYCYAFKCLFTMIQRIL